jgi:hypothetical protein
MSDAILSGEVGKEIEEDHSFPVEYAELEIIELPS